MSKQLHHLQHKTSPQRLVTALQSARIAFPGPVGWHAHLLGEKSTEAALLMPQ